MHPALVRRLLLPLHERLLGRPTLAMLDGLERSQWLSRADVERLQAMALKRLLDFALEHSPWHAARIRAAGLNTDSADLLSDLRRLPTMDKADASAHREEMVWRGVPGGAHAYTTGGSSGTPLRFFFGRRRQAADAACRLRARAWWGHGVGDREVLLWGAPVELNKTDAVRTLRDRCFNQLLLNAFDMNAASMDRYLDAIERFRPSCLYGYASSLALLAAHARSRSRCLRLPSLKVVYATGEQLFAHQRQLIANVFAAPVANEYGCRDGGLVAMESPGGQMLLSSEAVILEVLDPQGREVPPGQTGEAVITNLCSEAQPFIRYRTGDLVRRSADPCLCGRGLHVIGEILGRRTDLIVRRDGGILHALSLIHVLREARGVAEFKVVQHDIDRFEVLIRPASDWRKETAGWISSRLTERLGDSARIEVALRDEIAPEASGKHRYVVSHVPLPSHLDIG